MDECGVITDPNYRDATAQSVYKQMERVRTAEKLAYAAKREEKWLNEPFLIEKLMAHFKVSLTKVMDCIKNKQH